MDTNRIIKIEELEAGDEIVVPYPNGQLRYYKIIRPPKLSQISYAYSKWSGTRCSMKMEKTSYIRNKGTEYERTVFLTAYFCTPEDHNCEKLIYGLQWRQMWLVKKEETSNGKLDIRRN